MKFLVIRFLYKKKINFVIPRILSNLITLTSFDLLLMSSGLLISSNLWIFYYTHSDNIRDLEVLATDVTGKKSVMLGGSMNTLVGNLIVIVFFLLNLLYIQKNNSQFFFNDNFYLTNSGLTYGIFVLALAFVVILSNVSLRSSNNQVTSEYLIFIILIFIISIFLLCSTNLITTIALLELVALLVFGKFIVSKHTFENAANKIHDNTMTLTTKSNGLNHAVFVHFWANFTSSVLLIYSIINIYLLCGTTDFVVVNYIYTVMTFTWNSPEHYVNLSTVLFVMGFLIKLGLAPYQFFKIETYKGIPFFMVILYTTIYLIVYIYFIVNLIIIQLPSLHEHSWFYFAISTVISMLYLLKLLFDTKNFKAFLSYSTLVTVTNLFVILWAV